MATPNSQDELSFIHDGVTVTTLAQIFGMDHKEVNKRIVGKITPVSAGKFTKYRIRDAAPCLIDLQIGPEKMIEMLKGLSPNKFPPALQDAFWKSLLSRQKYEENKGELWRTARVFEVVSSAFKVLRISILMFTDTVSERTELTPQQREIWTELSDGLLDSLSTALIEQFKDYEPTADEHGKALLDDDTVIPTSTPEDDDGVSFD